MVELALVIMIFLMIVLGIMEFGYAFMVTQAMVTAAREAARYASVTENLQANDPRVQARCQERLVSAGVLNGNCENTKPQGKNDNVEVTVKVQYSLITGINTLFGDLQRINLVRIANFRYEGP